MKKNNVLYNAEIAKEKWSTPKVPLMKSKTNWKQNLSIDLRGSLWVSLFTFVMLSKLVFVCFLDSKDFTTGSLTAYGTVLGAFATSKIASKVMNGRNGHTVEED